MKEFDMPKPFYLYSKSSIYKTPLILTNSVIDLGYRGELTVLLRNLSNEHYVIEAGTKLVQICSRNLESFNYKIVKNLSNSERDQSDFGSTGTIADLSYN